MARGLTDLERDISALSKADKERLLDFLMLDAECPPDEVRALVGELNHAVERTKKSLDSTLAYLDGLDERLALGRIRARDEARRSDERWPFDEPPRSDPDL